MTRLVVHLNGTELYDVEPAAPSVETDGDLAVEFRNHGQPVHVHLRPDEALGAATAVEGTNHYVEGESALVVDVPVDDDAAGTSGRLEFVTGYGKGSAGVGVTVTAGESVPVDEDLGRAAGGGTTADGRSGTDPEPGGAGDAAGGGGSTGPGNLSSTGSLPGVADGSGRLAGVAQSRASLGLVALAAVALLLAGVAAVAARGLAVVAGIFAVLVGLGVAGYVMAR